MQIKYKRSCFICFALLLAVTSCKKFVEIDAPRTELVRTAVFASDATANAAVIDIYYQLPRPFSFAGGGKQSVTFLTSLSADDLVNALTNDNELQQLYNNAILPDNNSVLFAWLDL